MVALNTIARIRAGIAPFAVALAGMAFPCASSAKAPTIVLVGGPLQGYPDGEHDYVDGVQKIERIIRASSQFATLKPVIKTYPAGFPDRLAELDDADVVLLYDGLEYHLDKFAPMSFKQQISGARLAEMKKLMAKGVGFIALHQASTVPDEGSDVPMADWVGGVRFGMADRSTEFVSAEIAEAGHPVASGLKPFILHDEFYPSITFSNTTKVTPILRAKVHVQYRANKPVFEEPPTLRVVAWAAERPDGGRSFAFTGGHYLASFDQPQVATMLLNALLWSIKQPVPAQSPAVVPPGEHTPQKVVLPAAGTAIEPQPWGKLEWFASRALGNSTKMTTGRATISPGKGNPVHWHPNCDEILHVVSGHIMHRVGDREYEMHAGDTVTIPQGTRHGARNIGNEDAVLEIAFSSADRVAIGEAP